MSERTGTKGIDDCLIDVVRSLPVIGACMYAKEDRCGGEQHWYEQGERMEQASSRPYFEKWQKRILGGALAAMAATSLAFYAHLAYYSNASKIKWNRSTTISPKQNRVHFWFFEDDHNTKSNYCVEIDIGGKEPKLVRITQSSSEDLRTISHMLDKDLKDITRASKRQIEADNAKYAYVLKRIREHVKEKPELRVYTPPWILENEN